MKGTIHKRTFEAKRTYGIQRNELNMDPLTSEYMPSMKWLVRVRALMSDGSPNPAQEFHNHPFRTRAEAERFNSQ